MARIPDAELERMKAEVSVEQLVRAHGIGLVKSGRDWRGRCPFHEDGTPSLVVTPSKNLWHCFGCGLGGGPVDWAMKANGISFRHAVELLREGIPALAAKAGERTTVRALESPVSVEVDDAALLDQVVDYYHQSLKSSPEALAYLEKRGIAGAVEHFRLGYANRTLGLRLPEKNRVAGEAIRTRLQRIGVIRESGHEHLNGCIVFGWRDEAGHVAGLYGRKIVENQARNLPKHLYLPGPHRGVFNAEGLRGQREVIVCESVIDALTFWCAGYTNVTAAFGADGFTEDHLALFRAQGVERVHVDTFDLYHAKARANYIARAAAELRLTDDVVKADLGRVLLKLEMLQAAADAPAAGAQMTADEEREALELELLRNDQ